MNLKFHTACEMFPLMEGAEFDALVADISRHGQREPILYVTGRRGCGTKLIIDGRNRLRACEKLGVKPHMRRAHVHISGLEDPQIDPYVVSLNLHRRHLTGEQRRTIIDKLLKANPEASNRQVAEQVKVDHHTVSARRGELESTGEIPQLDKTTGKDGKKRSAKRKPAAKPEAGQPPEPPRAPGQIFTHEEKLCAELTSVIARWCALVKKQRLPGKMVATARTCIRELEAITRPGSNDSGRQREGGGREGS